MRSDDPSTVHLRINAVALIDTPEAREVAYRLLEDTARDLQLKLLLLADGLPGVDMEHKSGNGTLISRSLTNGTLNEWLSEQDDD